MRQGVRNKAGRRDAYASLRAEPAIGDNLLDTRVISSTGGSLRTADAEAKQDHVPQSDGFLGRVRSASPSTASPRTLSLHPVGSEAHSRNSIDPVTLMRAPQPLDQVGPS